MSKFTILNAKSNDVAIVDFVNYGCNACRTTSKLLVDYAKDHPNIKLVVRPVPFEGENTEYAVKMVMAAGLQGKFWEFHDAIINYDQALDESFFKQTAELYDIKYDQMVKDGNDAPVFELMRSNAETTNTLFNMTGLKTTPAIMVGKSFYQPQGIISLQELVRMIRFEQTGTEEG